MHFAGGLRRSPGLDCLLMGLRVIGALVAIAAWLAPATACAQFLEAPLPHRPSLEWTVAALADCGVRMPPQKVLDCFGAYMDAFLPEHVALDAQYAEFLASQQLLPHAATSVRQTRRLNEIEEESMRAESALLDQLCACLAEAAPDQAERIRDARAAMQVDVLLLRCAFAPSDIAMWLRSGSINGRGGRSDFPDAGAHLDDEEHAANGERLRLIRTARVAERTAAYQAFLKERAAVRMEHAKLAEQFGVQGMRLEAAQKHAGTNEVSRAFFFDLGPSAPGWMGVLRAQLQAYQAVEPHLTDEQRASLLHGSWYRSLANSAIIGGDGVDFRTPGVSSVPLQAPRDIISGVLRLNSLSAEQREAVRQFGRQWVAEAHRELEAKIQRALAEGGFPQEPFGAQPEPSPKLAELARLLGMSKGQFGRLSISTADCTVELSEADAREFGRTQLSASESARLPVADRARESNARSYGRVYALPEDYPAVLGRLLELDAGQQAVLQSLFDDHRSRWAKDVSPMLQSKSPPPEEREAARACDAEFFAAVKAALGAAVDPAALQVAVLARRVSEGAGWNPGQGEINGDLCNIPRVVAEASLSLAGRKAAIGAVLKDAERWTALANSMAECRAHFPPDDATRARQVALSQEWMALSAAAEDAVAQALPDADKDEWRRGVRRERWPFCYRDSGQSRKEFARALRGSEQEQALLKQVGASFDRADKRLQRIGDAAAACMEQARTLPTLQDRDPDEGAGRSRAQALLDLSEICLQLARTEARAQLPPDVARAIYPDVPLDRMAQTAAPPVATPASSP